MRRCPFCGQQVEGEATFCKHCMRSLASEVPKKSNLAGYLVVALLAVGAVVVISSWPDLREALTSPVPDQPEATDQAAVLETPDAVPETVAPPAVASPRPAAGTPAPQVPRVPAPRSVSPTQGREAVSRESKTAVPSRPAPPTPVPAAPTPSGPIRVGGNIKPPTKLKDVRPVYPSVAVSARVQGVVIIEATIGANGKVQNARVLRSIPMLDQSALDAVRQWEYTPTFLEGVAVPVIMTVTVNYSLQ